MKKQRIKTIPMEQVTEIMPRHPELLEARICSRCLMHPAISNRGLCRNCERAAQKREK
jgi:hypothetical protein